MNKKVVFVAMVAMLLGSMLLGACKPAAPALGTEKNPIIWAVVPSGETERVVAGFEKVAKILHDETGLVVKPLVATEYAGVIEALSANPPKAQMASLATFAYILASQKKVAEVELVSQRFGSEVYNGQIFVKADSGINSIKDLKGKTFCRPDPLSTSGWIIPMITLKAAGINPDTDLAKIVDAGSHDAAVTGVYKGDCDAGSSYVDARTRIEKDFPDVMQKVSVIEVSVDIPNDGVQYAPSFPKELREKLNKSLIAMGGTEAGKAALKEAYQWDALVAHDDKFYDPFRQVLDSAGIDVNTLLK